MYIVITVHVLLNSMKEICLGSEATTNYKVLLLKSHCYPWSLAHQLRSETKETYARTNFKACHQISSLDMGLCTSAQKFPFLVASKAPPKTPFENNSWSQTILISISYYIETSINRHRYTTDTSEKRTNLFIPKYSIKR